MVESTPDPTETVTLLKSDFDLLQAAANAGHEDYLNICALMRIEPPEGVVPRQFMHDVVLPGIAHLVATQTQVDQVSSEIRERAARFGNKTATINGKQGLLVGKRVPGLFGPGS